MDVKDQDIVFPDVDTTNVRSDPEADNFLEHIVRESGHARWKIGEFHAYYWDTLQEEWREAVREYEANPGSFYQSWRYLNEHPVYWRFRTLAGYPRNHVVCLEHGIGMLGTGAFPVRHAKGPGFGSGGIDVMVVRCDESGRVQNDPALNTQTEVWLETGKWELIENEHGHHSHYHDYELDTGARTYEEAVILLAHRVHARYGNDRQIADALE